MRSTFFFFSGNVDWTWNQRIALWNLNLKFLFETYAIEDFIQYFSYAAKNVKFVKVNISFFSRCFYEPEFLFISQWTRITVWQRWRKTKLMDHWRVWHGWCVRRVSILLLVRAATGPRVETNGLPAYARQAGMQASSNALN